MKKRYLINALFAAMCAALVGAGLIGCAPMKPYVVSDSQRDPQFVLIEMLATGLVLGGVTVTAFPVTVEERNNLTAKLEDVLNHFSFYRFNTPETLARRISPDRYEKIMGYFRENKTVPVEELQYLETQYTPARYLLFVNIDSNTVTQYKAFNPNGTDFQTIRTIVATLNITSMQTKAPAIFTRITFKDVNTNTVQRMSAGGVFGNMVAQVTFGGFPEPPPLEQTLYKVFLAVADQVPNN